jgi:hypothetical protein
MFPYSFGVKSRYDTYETVGREYKAPGMLQGVQNGTKAANPKKWSQFVNTLPPTSGGAVLIQALRLIHDNDHSSKYPAAELDAAEVIEKLHNGREQGMPCVIGWTPFLGDGLGAQIARAIEHNISGTILGCITKCAPTTTLFATSAVFAHQPDGATVYCHVTNRPLKSAAHAITELEREYVSITPFSLEHKKKNTSLRNAVERLPQSYTDSLACSRIPNFSDQVAEIAPCVSPKDYGRDVHAYLSSTSGTGLDINKLVDAVLQLPPKQRERATTSVRDAFNVLRSTRQSNAKHRQDHCGSGPRFPASHDADAIVVAVHIRTGDHFKTEAVKLEICFLHWMLALFRKHLPEKKVRIHIHTETSKHAPDKDGQFVEFSDLLVFPTPPPPHPPQQQQEHQYDNRNSEEEESWQEMLVLPSWCGASSLSSSPPSAPPAAAPRFIGRLNMIGEYPAVENVVLHPNGNPLGSILCIADADVIVEGTSSSFVNIAKLLSLAVKARPHITNESHKGNLRHRSEHVQLAMGPESHLEYSAVEKSWWYGPNHTSPDYNTAKECPELNTDANAFLHQFSASQKDIRTSILRNHLTRSGKGT